MFGTDRRLLPGDSARAGRSGLKMVFQLESDPTGIADPVTGPRVSPGPNCRPSGDNSSRTKVVYKAVGYRHATESMSATARQELRSSDPLQDFGPEVFVLVLCA